MKRPAYVFLFPVLVAIIAAGITLLLYPFVHFARPRAFWWLLALVALTLVWAWRAAARARIARALMHPNAVSALTGSWSPRRSALRMVLIALASYLLIIAGAQPQWGEKTRHVQRKGTDIAVVLDASRSMLAEDASPNRLRAATNTLNQLLSTLNGDRVGLIIFAGIAFTQSPLTTDYGAIHLYLNRVNPTAIPAQGTAIGRAITQAHQLLVGGNNPNFKRAPHQIMIVISDGEDHQTRPIEAAQKAQEDGIQIFTIGVGTEAGGRIPLQDHNGNFTHYLTDNSGKVVQTKLKDKQLREIAKAGNGTYFHAKGDGLTAKNLATRIDEYDQSYLSSVLRAHYVNRGIFFLLPAFVILLLALLIDDRPRRHRPRRWWNLLLIACLVLPTSGCLDFRHTDPHVRRAIKAARADKPDDALKEISKANSDAQSQHAYHFNRGRMHDANGDIQAAQNDFLHALGASRRSLRIDALIGIGNTLTQQGSYDAAIQRYERALSLDPDNKTARHNLEVAHRKRFPACSALEDALEPNDNRGTASALPTDSYVGPYASYYQKHAQQLAKSNPATAPSPPSTTHKKAQNDDKNDKKLVLCGGNEDWYRLPLHGGEQLTLDVRFDRLREDDGGPPLPDRINPSGLRIALVDKNQNIVQVDEGQASGKNSPRNVSAKHIERHIRTPSVNPVDAPYSLEISAKPGLEYHYKINAAIIPACEELEDTFEPNDAPGQAHLIKTGQHKGQLCNGNADWFNIDLDKDDHLFVDVQSTTTSGQQGPTIRAGFEATGNAPPDLHTQTKPGEISWASGLITEPTTALWGLETAHDNETPYTMSVYHFPACPKGNDRFEPNDHPKKATPLKPDQNEVRHLRLCPDDQDWFVMQFPPDKEHKKSGGTQSSKPASQSDPTDKDATKNFSALAQVSDPSTKISVEMWNPTTGKRIAASTPATKTDEKTGETTYGAVASAPIPKDTQAVIIRVQGDPSFYSLHFPDLKPPPQQNNANNQQKNKDKQDQGGDQQNAKNKDAQDQKGQKDDEHKKDQENASREQASKNTTDNAPKSAHSGAIPTDKQAKRKALMDLLENLGDHDVNLQLQQALEHQDRPVIQKQW